MAMYMSRFILQCYRRGQGLVRTRSVCPAFFHTNSSLGAGGNWREQRGMSRTGTSYGPLTDLPDWCYLDGSPAPQRLSKRQMKRMRKVHAIGKRVRYLLKEVDFAKMQSGKNSYDNDDGHYHDGHYDKNDDVDDDNEIITR